jgi:hypothetical protein
MVRWLLCGFVLCSFLSQQSSSASDARVASVQVKGNKRYSAEEVTRLSGVEIGRAASPDATMLAKKWKLKPGDVYDDSYVTKYLQEEIVPLKTADGGRGNLSTRLDTDRHVVDVKIVFK